MLKQQALKQGVHGVNTLAIRLTQTHAKSGVKRLWSVYSISFLFH